MKSRPSQKVKLDQLEEIPLRLAARYLLVLQPTMTTDDQTKGFDRVQQAQGPSKTKQQNKKYSCATNKAPFALP
jgi:hypothetical protein